MFRDTASYIGSICFFSFQLNWIYQTCIAFLLCAKPCGYKNERGMVCAQRSSWSCRFGVYHFLLLVLQRILLSHPHRLFFFVGVGGEGCCFFCLYRMWVGFLPSTVSKLSQPCPFCCCNLPNSRAIAALGRRAYASGFEKEASCHNQRIGAKSLVNHGSVRGKNRLRFSEFWEEKWLWF